MSLLRRVLGSSGPQFDYDFVVIGGGSGGLAAAKEAAKQGAKCCLFDFVAPTAHGTKWGLGGTCVNVGCIPKKLMHRSARIAQSIKHDFHAYGWNVSPEHVHFDWSALVQNIQLYIKQLNFGYRSGLTRAGVEYINAFAQVVGDHKVRYTFKQETIDVTAKYILVAVGGRPVLPSEQEVPGARAHAVTSDDLFSLTKAPGKTLIVGASYIALECAGFLNELGFPVCVAVRSMLLRHFDRQCAEKIGLTMRELGCEFKMPTVVESITKLDSGKLRVHFSNAEFEDEEFDCVLYATGRIPSTEGLGLDSIGVKVESNGKIRCDESDTTNVPYLFAVGDTALGRPELTPVAIRAGELLARRLFGGATKLMDYHNVPTTVFTPIEYACCGLSEEDAAAKYGAKNLEIYLSEFNSLEILPAHWQKNPLMATNEFDTDVTPINLTKLICLKTQNEKIVGIHFIGLNAGETMQGYAIALKAGLTKSYFDEVVGIHPTDAESFHSLSITKSSGLPYTAKEGCGGGKCG